MKSRILAAIGLCTLFVSSSAWAGDKDFDQNTVLMISSNNMSKMKTGWNASQYGSFMSDPAISKLWSHLEKGLTTLVKQGIESQGMSEEDRAEFNKFSSLLSEYWTTLGTEVTGRFSVALGYRNDEGGAMQPNLLIHFQGGEKIAGIHSRLIDLLVSSSDGQVARTSMEFQGVTFHGFNFPPEEGPPMIKMPDGLFFGNKGSDYYVGISKDGMSNYIKSAAATTSAGTGRLGGVAHYKHAVGATSTGDLNVFVNLQPLWQFIPMAVQMSAPQDAEEIMGVLQALGIMNLQGIYSTSSMSGTGAQSDSFLAIKERKGLFSLIPNPGQTVQIPTFAPKGALSAQVGRLQLDKTLDLIMNLAGQIGGEQARQEIQNGLGEMEQEFGGIKVAELVANLEGSLAWIDQEQKGDGGGGMAMMSDPTAMLGRLVVGLKLKDTAIFERLLTTIASHPEIGGMVKVESFLNRKVYLFGDESSPEFSGGMPTPGVAIDKGWLVIGLKGDDLKDALRASQGDATGQLASDPKFAALANKVGGNGMWIMHQDVGKTIGGLAEMMKMMVGLLAMGLPEEIFSNKDLMYVLSPQNIPSSALFEKYFGQQVANMKVVEGGIVGKGWMPNKMKKSAAPKKATGR